MRFIVIDSGNGLSTLYTIFMENEWETKVHFGVGMWLPPPPRYITLKEVEGTMEGELMYDSTFPAGISKETKVIDNDLNPEWNEVSSCDIPLCQAH